MRDNSQIPVFVSVRRTQVDAQFFAGIRIPHCTSGFSKVYVHPDDVRELGVASGDRVAVVLDDGIMPAIAVEDATMPAGALGDKLLPS